MLLPRIIIKGADLSLFSLANRFEGVAYLNHARGKVQLVTVVVLSDVVFFLQESNQKFHFVTQDNKVIWRCLHYGGGPA